MPIHRGSLSAPPGSYDNSATVAERQVAPPDVGFGQLWRKELSVILPGGPPSDELMTCWKEHLEELWPAGGTLYRRRTSLEEGELLGVDLGVGPVRLSTGVVVVESNKTSLTLLTPEGHMFAGWNTFRTQETAQGTMASVTTVARASDPLYEIGLLLVGHRTEEWFWSKVLSNLADRFGEHPEVRVIRRRIDRRRHWRRARNIVNNAFIRTMVRRLERLLGVGGR